MEREGIVVEPRRLDPAVRRIYDNYTPGRIRRPIQYALVHYALDFKTVKAITETEQHHEAAGTFVMVSAVNQSRVIYFELAPVYGRLWHQKHLHFSPAAYRNRVFDPTQATIGSQHYNIPPGYMPPLYYSGRSMRGVTADPVSDFRTFMIEANSSGDIAYSGMTDYMLARLRTPDEYALAIGIDNSHALYRHYTSMYMKVIHSTFIPTSDIIFSLLREYSPALYASARIINAEFTSWICRPGMLREIISDLRTSITGLQVRNIMPIYPPDGDILITEMNVPFHAFDFSISEFSLRGSQGFVKIRVPESLPDGIYYPHVWNLMVGEVVITPIVNVDPGASSDFRVYTPAGNSAPVSCFEIIA